MNLVLDISLSLQLYDILSLLCFYFTMQIKNKDIGIHLLNKLTHDAQRQ